MAEMFVPPNAEHLGGYVKGGDEATYYPELWDWFVKGPLEVKSVLDVGCGDGIAVRHFRKYGIHVKGIDGVKQSESDIFTHDFTKGPTKFRKTTFDLVWSCEFVEHVEERYMRNYLENFKTGRHVAITHAFPGQPGHHHVNCRVADYWIGVMAAIGFEIDIDMTNLTRTFAATNESPWNHYVRSGLFFKRLGP